MSPLYRKLLLWFCAANIAVLLVSVFVTDRIGRHVSLTEPDWDELASEALAAYENRGLLGLASVAEHLRRVDHVDVTLYRNGENLLQRRPLPPLRPFLPQLLAAQTLTLKAGDGLWLASRALTSAQGERLQFVALRGPMPPHARRDLLLAVQIVLSLAVIAGLGFVLARSLTAPIAAIQSATRRMAGGDLASRADAATAARGDELGALARDFNDMAQRTETLVQQQRTVLQDVSHELRSPLARLHVLLELTRHSTSGDGQQQLDRAAQEVGRLDALIGEVLNLSRLESALPGLAPGPVALDTLLRQVVEQHALEAGARQLTVHAPAETGLILLGDAALLARALGNVLGNAIKFSPAGAAIWLTAAAAAGRATITVRDQGPGVPAHQLGQLFQPFFRGQNAALAEGHGLGLAIARRIVDAHGGSLSARNGEAGGLEVSLAVPLSGA